MSAVSAIPLALALTAFLGVSLGVRVPNWLCQRFRGAVPMPEPMPELQDIVAQAKEALDTHPCPCGEEGCNRPNPRQLARLVPKLVAEIERLRAEAAGKGDT